MPSTGGEHRSCVVRSLSIVHRASLTFDSETWVMRQNDTGRKTSTQNKSYIEKPHKIGSTRETDTTIVSQERGDKSSEVEQRFLL